MNFLFPGVYNTLTYTYSVLKLTPPNYGACDKQTIYDLHLTHMGKLWSTIDSVYTKIVTLPQVIAGMSEDDLDHVHVIVHDLKEVLIPE